MKKKILFIGLPAILIVAISGFFFWRYFTSPNYSLLQIKNAIENHDVTSFEKYVDLDSVTTRILTELPEILGSQKDMGYFGEETAEIILGFIKESFVKITREAVRTFIERGHFDKTVTEKGSLSKILKQIPIDSFKFISLQEIKTEGKICKVPLQIYIESFEGNTTLELMLRDKGSYWQIAEVSNLSDFMHDVMDLQKTFPYRNRYAAVLYVANSIKKAVPKARALGEIAGELAKAGEIEKALKTADSIKDAWQKAWALGSIAGELAKAGNKNKEEDAKIANLIMTTFIQQE